MKTFKNSLPLILVLLVVLLTNCKDNFKDKALDSGYFIGSWEWYSTFTPTMTLKHKLIFYDNGKGKMTSYDGLILSTDGLISFDWAFDKTNNSLIIGQEKYRVIEHGKDYFVRQKDEESLQRITRN